MSDFRTRFIALRSRIAAHSITDERPIFDSFHFYKIASQLLDAEFGKMISKLSTNMTPKFRYSLPTFYYKNMDIQDGSDDDIINGELFLTASDFMFPEIIIRLAIKDRQISMPHSFMYKNNKFEMSPGGLEKFFTTVNPRFVMDAKKQPTKPLGAKIRTVFFGEPSTTRTDLLSPVETGDEFAWTRAHGTAPFVGV